MMRSFTPGQGRASADPRGAAADSSRGVIHACFAQLPSCGDGSHRRPGGGALPPVTAPSPEEPTIAEVVAPALRPRRGPCGERGALRPGRRSRPAPCARAATAVASGAGARARTGPEPGPQPAPGPAIERPAPPEPVWVRQDHRAGFSVTTPSSTVTAQPTVSLLKSRRDGPGAPRPAREEPALDGGLRRGLRPRLRGRFGREHRLRWRRRWRLIAPYRQAGRFDRA